MRFTVAYSKIKKQNLVLINNDTHQRETVSERPIRPPLIMFSYIRQTICSSLTFQHCAENVVALLHIAPIITGENENEAVCKHQQLLKA